jgi:hypothetical protein
MRKPAQVGDAVTVVYDPDEPACVRTTEEPNENQILVGFSVIPLLSGFAGPAQARPPRRARLCGRAARRLISPVKQRRHPIPFRGGADLPARRRGPRDGPVPITHPGKQG